MRLIFSVSSLLFLTLIIQPWLSSSSSSGSTQGQRSAVLAKQQRHAAAFSDVHADNDSDDPLKVIVIPNPLKDGIWHMPFSARADPSEATEFFCSMYIKGFCYRSRDKRCPRLKLLCQFLKRAAAPPRSVIRQQLLLSNHNSRLGASSRSTRSAQQRRRNKQWKAARSTALRLRGHCIARWIVCVKEASEGGLKATDDARKAVKACKVTRNSCLRRARTRAPKGPQSFSKTGLPQKRTAATAQRHVHAESAMLRRLRLKALKVVIAQASDDDDDDDDDEEEEAEEKETEEDDQEDDDDALALELST
jgi:hypothetical protein